MRVFLESDETLESKSESISERFGTIFGIEDDSLGDEDCETIPECSNDERFFSTAVLDSHSLALERQADVKLDTSPSGHLS